jgi:replication factor C subunit 3/5
MNSLDNLPWIEKYRPKSLDEVVSQNNIIETLGKFIEIGQLPHLLFYGPPGSGKTSSILSIATKIYGSNIGFMVLELNASDTRGIEDVRTQIKNFAGTRNFFNSGTKLVILDEADNMTKEAQSALRRVIETYTHNVRFCLICNYVSKIIPALQSRCTKFRFSPLKNSKIIERVKYIITKENVKITQNGLHAVLNLSLGDMRKVLNIIQSTSLTHNPIKEKHVYLTTGKPSPSDIASILESLFNDTILNSINFITKIQTKKGLDLLDIVIELYTVIMKISLNNKNLNYFLKEISELEKRLEGSTNTEIQLGSLVSIFHHIRN